MKIPESRYERGARYAFGDVTVLDLHGSWRDMGRQYGALLSPELHHVHAFACANPDGMSYRDLLGEPTPPAGVRRLDELFRGAAETSGLTLEQLKTANAVEVIYLNHVHDAIARSAHSGHCSIMAAWDDWTGNGLVYGGNYDWLPEFRELLPALTISVFHPADGALPVATVNWAGCLYLTNAMNAAGICLGLTSGMFAEETTAPERLHNVWLLWEFLLNIESLEAMDRLFMSCRGAGHYLICAADAKRALGWEWAVHRPTVHVRGQNGLVVVTNHFTQPGWTNLPAADRPHPGSSVNRHRNLCALARQFRGRITPETMKQLMINPVEAGGPCAPDTLFHLVAQPAQRLWMLRTVDRDTWNTIPVGELLDGTE